MTCVEIKFIIIIIIISKYGQKEMSLSQIRNKKRKFLIHTWAHI